VTLKKATTIKTTECGSDIIAKMILILSNKWDISADLVVAELRRQNYPFLRLNTEDLVSGIATVTLPNLKILVSKRKKIYDLAKEVRVIWNRRPGKPYDDVPLENRPSEATQRFVNDQWYSWLESLQLLPGVVWINHPQANNAMESKIRQLWLASNMGFTIPKTLISNDPDKVRSYLKFFGGKIVTKALYSPLIEEKEKDCFIFTNEIDKLLTTDDDQIRLSPCIFQKSLMPKIDYRVTVVGETVMPVKIESEKPSEGVLDWRTSKDGLNFSSCTLPQKIETLCRRLVKDYGLLFGAIDLVEYNRKFVFLEINPNGEWGWLQKPNGLPIAETLCKLMIESDARQEK
jgi:glutathione synthase/RimK-type ligase-like ATP-grasp enzyme